MELKRKALCFLSLVLWFQAFSVLQCIGQTQNKYVDENLPRGQARIFAPGVVSMPRGEGFYEERPVFSPDFKEVFFDLNNYKDKTFTSLHMRYENGKWTSPEPAFFTKYKGFQPTISADGKRLFFITPRPQDDKRRSVWMVERQSSGWTDPILLDSPINSFSVGFVCLTKSDTLYFFVMDPSDQKGVYRSELAKGKYSSIEKLSSLQPTKDVLFGDFYVSPDESYVIIYSTLPGNLGQGDLYIIFQTSDGVWAKPQNLGNEVNTPKYDFAPSISPDGKFLFFTRDSGREGDIYWISSEIIKRLKPEEK